MYKKSIILFLVICIITTGCATKEEKVEKQEEQKNEESISDIYETSNWDVTPSEYIIFDINKDNIEELLIKASDDGGFDYTLILSYDKEKKEIIKIDNLYGYGSLSYDDKTNAITYSETRPTSMLGGYGFYVLKDNKLELDKTIGQENGEFFIIKNKERKSITEDEQKGYYEKVEDFEYISLP